MVRSILTRLATFTLATLLGACCLAAKPPAEVQPLQPTWNIPVWIDSDFTPKNKHEIELALSEWNSAAGGYLHFYVASEAIKHPIDKDLVFPKLRPFTDSGITINIEGAEHPTVLWHSNILAWTDNVGDADIHVVMTRLRHGDFSLKGIVEHEIAHSLGLDHSDHAGNLMSNNYEDQVMCIDDQTVKRLFRLHHWALDYMNPAC